MTKNPFINAFFATLYITLVAVFMYYGTQLFPQKDNVLAPIAMISLFTLSAAIMAYVFLYQPIILFISGHQKSAVKLFLQTIAAFAGITLLVFVLLFFWSF